MNKPQKFVVLLWVAVTVAIVGGTAPDGNLIGRGAVWVLITAFLGGMLWVLADKKPR